MPDSNGAREEALHVFERRFGVPPDALADLTFVERPDEIWVCRSHPPSGIQPERPSGLRALRRVGTSLKPTSAFLAALGERITTSRVDLDRDSLRAVLLGRRILLTDPPADGYVALCYRGDVLGCGQLRGGLLHGLIPTGRRRELLAALAVDPRI